MAFHQITIKALFKALCGIVWIIEFEFTSDEVNHVDEIINIPISPGSSFGQFNLTEPFEKARHFSSI